MTTHRTKRFAILGFVFTLGAGTTTLFQNCSKASFNQAQDSVSLSSSGGLITFAQTTLNTPVAFTMKHADKLTNVRLDFVVTEPHGTFSTLDANSAKIMFSPEFGFRGRQEATVKITDRYGSTFDLYAVIDVGNGISALEPALAVRGMGCIACHAKVTSNLITDFGFGGDGKGRDYYFGGPSTAYGRGVFNAHGSDFSPWILNAGQSVFVPAAPVPAKVIAALSKDKPTTVKTLADFVSDQFSRSGDAGTRAVNVVPAQSVYIGAPTAAQIDATLKLGGARLRFYKNEVLGPDLAGLSDRQTYFKNTGTLVCDGDVGVRGPLLLEDLKVQTKTGCRLYVIGSVFIQGSITYVGSADDRNLQITSSRLISMGLGQTQRNGVDCSAADRYSSKADGSPSTYGRDSFTARVKSHGTSYGFVSRESGDAGKLADDAVVDYQIVTRGEGAIYDAICLPSGRDVAFDRVLLNAPQVQNRFRGNVDGTIIAETALMALGNFKFTFDQVFNRVPVLPFLSKSICLDVR